MSAVAEQIDPNVTIPAAVRAAAAASDAAHKAVYSPEQEANTEGSGLTFDSNQAPVEQPSETPPAPTEAHSEKDWENNYKAMKGRYDRLRAEHDIVVSNLATANRTIAELRAAHVQTPNSDTQFTLITPEEKNDYGDDLLNVVGKRAKEVLSPEVEALKQQVASLQSQFGGVSQVITQTERDKLYAKLDASVPEWEKINSDPKFLSWLGLTDTYSGAIRRELLNAAFARNNAAQVAAFFQGFLRDEAAQSPAGSEADTSKGLTPPKMDLAKFAAPGRAKAAAGNSSPAEKPTFTRADITAFYSDVRRGVYAGRDAEKLAREQAIFEAQMDGRIR